MREQIERAVAEIFEDYEQTPELRELREEVAANLYERVQDMIKRGTGEHMALQSALDELGDITEAADALSLQKRGEFIGQAYGRAVPLDSVHVVGYPVAGAVLLLGLAVLAWVGVPSGSPSRILGLLIPFVPAAAGGFTYLGMTQETRTHYPVKSRRGIGYGLAAMVLALGLLLGLAFLFRQAPAAGLHRGGLRQVLEAGGGSALGALLFTVLPGGVWLALLVLTQGERRKPWVLRMEEEQSHIYDERFGLLSGALWIAATAVFLLLGLLWSWRTSWLVYLFAAAGQCVLQYRFLGKR